MATRSPGDHHGALRAPPLIPTHTPHTAMEHTTDMAALAAQLDAMERDA